MVHRLSDESLARAAKSSAGRSRRPRNRVYPRQGTSSSDAPESTSDPPSSSSDPSPSSSSDTPMTTHTTSLHDTALSSSSHVMTENPTSTSHSMVEPSSTRNDPTTSSGAGPSSMRTTMPSTTQNAPSTSTHSPSEPSTIHSTTNPSTPTTTARPTSSPISRTTPTTTPQSTTPPPTSRATSDAVSTTPPSSSDPPNTPSTSSSRFTTTTPPPPVSRTSSSEGATTSITTPASSSRPTFTPSETIPISTDPVSTPPASSSSEPSSSVVESSSNPPASETQTVSSPATTTIPPAVTSSAQETSAAPTESDTPVTTNSSTDPVVTSGSVILSSASEVQVSLTTTNSLGQTTIGIPPLYTTTYTSTSNGIPLTITAVVSQATTLNTDGGGSTSPFFKNKGAVAGVFIVVGIAGAAIILFGIFTYLRRRKMRRLTREAAIAATLGSGRTPFVDDDDADAYGSGPSGGNSTEMGYHSASETRPVYGSYGAAYGAGAAYGYGPDPFYGNPPAGNSFNASSPGSTDHHGPGPMNPQGLLPPAPTAYGAAGGPNLPPTTPLLAKGNQVTVPPAATPASPPSVYSNTNIPKGYEYDYSNFAPPSAVDGAAGRGMSPSPTSPTFSKRSSLPLPPPGAAAPSYAALAAAAGLVSDPSGPPTTNIPPSAYQGAAYNKPRRTSNTPSFASSASRYSVDTPGADAAAQTPGLPTYSVANGSKSQSVHSFNASSSNQSHGRPPTPGAEVLLGGDRGGLVRSASGGSDWRAGGRPETPLIDHRLDPDTVLAAKGRSPGNRLSDYSTPSEESLGSLQDHEDYSRRVLQVTNPS